MRVLRRDRIGGLSHEYPQVAWGDMVSGTHRVLDEYVAHYNQHRPHHMTDLSSAMTLEVRDHDKAMEPYMLVTRRAGG